MSLDKLKQYIKKLDTGGTTSTVPQWYLNLYTQHSLTDAEGKDNSFTTREEFNQFDTSSLEAPYKGLLSYQSNPEIMKQDAIKYLQEQQGDINQIINNYNNIVDTLHNTFSDGLTYNQNIGDLRSQFGSIYSSRNDNNNRSQAYGIGFIPSLQRTAGNRMWMSRPLAFEKDFENLTDEEKKNRSFKYDLNGQKYTLYWDKNGKLQLLNPQTNTSEVPVSNQNEVSPEVEEETPQTTTETNQPLKGLEFEKVENTSEPKEFWSDFIPLGGILANNLIASKKTSDLQKQQRFSLFQSPYLNAKVTNNYATRTALNQEAQNLRSIGQNLAESTSDITRGKQLADVYNQQADKYKLQEAQVKENAYNQSLEKANQVQNYNVQNSIKTANENRLKNDYVMNNILNANQRQILQDTSSLNDFIENAYTSYGQYLQTKRLEKARKERADADFDYEQGLKELEQLWNSYNNGLESWKNENPVAYQSFVNFAKGFENNPNLTDEQLNNIWNSTDDKWTSNTEFNKYKKQYQDWLKSKETQFQDRYNQLISNYKHRTGNIPQFVTNQWSFPNWFDTNSSRTSPAFKDGNKIEKLKKFAKGGKTIITKKSNNSDYIESIQNTWTKEKEIQFRKSQLREQSLQKNLDRLSNEQLLQLKALFR